MKILHLTLKKKWFDQIANDFKKEEYRGIKPYWEKRFLEKNGEFKKFDIIIFKNGYSKNSPEMIVEFKGITTGFPNIFWTDELNKEIYIIYLGKILSTKNC